jgi:competence ComEA-like helix-hairpin-helix protein
VVLYSRHQLLVLLVLVATFGGGLAVERWRRAHPEIAERLERLDRAGAPEIAVADRRQSSAASRPPKLRADGSPPIDLNRTTVEELTRLPGVGPALAARIVEARDARPFTSVEDLRRVRGLGQSTLERMRPLVTVDPR